jgi:hypothetical protein
LLTVMCEALVSMDDIKMVSSLCRSGFDIGQEMDLFPSRWTSRQLANECKDKIVPRVL